MITAKLNYLRIAPRKVRLVADLIRGKSAEEAKNILSFTIRKAANPLLKLLNSAIASALNNFQLDSADIFISKISVDEGPKYKRWMPRARGQASEIQKKSSHVNIVLDEIKKKAKRGKKVKEVKEEEKVEKVEKIEKAPRPAKTTPKPLAEAPKPKVERGIRRIFRRKAF
jgi:large subunit ribosomal protein L22